MKNHEKFNIIIHDKITHVKGMFELKDLTNGNSLRRTFFIFAVPLVLASLLSQGYSTVDTIIAGKFLGSDGLAATGATAALISVISSIFWGFGNGLGIYIAKLFGAKDYKRLKACIYINFALVAVAALTLSITLIVFHDIIFDWLKVDDAIRDDVFIYFSIYMSGFVFISFNQNCIYIMHALGVSSYPFYMSAISAVLNIAGNIVTIVILGLGVAGVALSTIFSVLVVTVCYMLKLRKCFKEMSVGAYKIHFSGEFVKCALPYSIPVTIQQTIMYIASVLVSPLVNGIGSAATAAYTVSLRIYDINATIYQNSTKTLTNYVAQCMGAKKYSNISRGIRIGVTQSTLFVLPVLIACVLFSDQICGAFFSKGYSGEDLRLASDFARFFMPFVLFNLINNAFHALCRAVKSMNLLLIATAIGSVARVAASFIFTKYYGMYGIYIGWVAAWLAEMIFVLIIYITGKWKPEELKEGL